MSNRTWKIVSGLQMVFVLLLPVQGRADTEHEIAHLLQFVGNSPCDFIRNGKHHDTTEARNHIQKKYSHVKRRVKTAEDFITYAATKSSMTGRHYMVVCDGREEPAGEWLLKELNEYRIRVAESTQ